MNTPDRKKTQRKRVLCQGNRHTTGTFLGLKLGESLEKRHVAPHIYESREEAQKALKKD